MLRRDCLTPVLRRSSDSQIVCRETCTKSFAVWGSAVELRNRVFKGPGSESGPGFSSSKFVPLMIQEILIVENCVPSSLGSSTGVSHKNAYPPQDPPATPLGPRAYAHCMGDYWKLRTRTAPSWGGHVLRGIALSYRGTSATRSLRLEGRSVDVLLF